MMFLVFIRHPKDKRIHFDEMNLFLKYVYSTDDHYEEYLHSE